METTALAQRMEALKKQWGIEVGIKIGILSDTRYCEGEIKGIVLINTPKALLLTLYPISLSMISNEVLTKVVLCEDGTALLGDDFQKEVTISL